MLWLKLNHVSKRGHIEPTVSLTDLPSHAVHAWVATKWQLHACINYSSGISNGVTEENLNARHFPLHQYVSWKIHSKFKTQILHGFFYLNASNHIWNFAETVDVSTGAPFRDRKPVGKKQQLNLMQTGCPTGLASHYLTQLSVLSGTSSWILIAPNANACIYPDSNLRWRNLDPNLANVSLNYMLVWVPYSSQ